MAISKVIYKSSPNATPETWMDATTATAAAADITSPKTAMLADGVVTTGTGTAGEYREDLTVPKDVDFIDFDGRLLYSYTAAEFLALTELPPNPSYPGLVAQGWNWTLADAKEFVAEYGAQVIGQNYTTDDGKTRLYIRIDSEQETEHPIDLYINRVGTCTYSVDWGDGTVETSTAGNYSRHQYESPGEYTIAIEVTAGTIRLGYYGSNHTIFSSSDNPKGFLKKIEIGDNVVGLCRNTFARFTALRSVSIPVTCVNHDTGSDISMFDAARLTGIVFPSGTPGQNTKMIGGIQRFLASLKYVSIPKTMNGFNWNGTYPQSLRKLIFPTYTVATTMYVYLYDVSRLTHFIVPGTYTTIPGDRCRASLIHKLTIPASVTTINATAFSYNGLLKEVHLLPSTPPTLSNANAFSSGPADRVYYVPYSEDHSILEAYQTATNWSTYASQMQEEPQ